MKDEIEFALLVHGLEAEREQRVTIDVAYRFFKTVKRSFIVTYAGSWAVYAQHGNGGIERRACYHPDRCS